MKSPARIDREIKRLSDFVNTFPRYDRTNAEQMRAFELLDVLEWARGKLHKLSPSELLANPRFKHEQIENAARAPRPAAEEDGDGR